MTEKRRGVGNSSQSNAVAGLVLWARNAEGLQMLKRAGDGLQSSRGNTGLMMPCLVSKADFFRLLTSSIAYFLRHKPLFR